MTFKTSMMDNALVYALSDYSKTEKVSIAFLIIGIFAANAGFSAANAPGNQ